MKARIVTTGLWQVFHHAEHVLCADGKRRYATLAPEADTWFSVPASVKVHGKTVRGYICAVTFHEDDMAFHPYLYCKNAKELPEYPSTECGWKDGKWYSIDHFEEWYLAILAREEKNG